MRALVTGVAGFIGSHLAESLLASGFNVVGIDNFSPYYSHSIKVENLENCRSHKGFTFIEGELSEFQFEEKIEGITHVFHQAGQPGVQMSWGKHFDSYVESNVLLTQRLLEHFKGKKDLKAFVAASSSSVYGLCQAIPNCESDLPSPISPYGVTKLASEHLCGLYASQHGMPIVSLRYFTVFGPRQRPDMLISKLISAAFDGSQIGITGDGTQLRDFTYVDDVIQANRLAAELAEKYRGQVFNIGRGSPVSINELIQLVEQLTASQIAVDRNIIVQGDPVVTYANCQKAAELLDWRPLISLEQGISRQISWFRDTKPET